MVVEAYFAELILTSAAGMMAWTAHELYNVSQEVSKNTQRSEKNQEKISRLENRFFDGIQN